ARLMSSVTTATLLVAAQGVGGSITADRGGLAVQSGTIGQATYPVGTEITLTPSPGLAPISFTGAGGRWVTCLPAVPNTPSCTLTLTENTVMAFRLTSAASYPLTLVPTGGRLSTTETALSGYGVSANAPATATDSFAAGSKITITGSGDAITWTG